LLKSYKNEIKILANPGLALSAFEKPGPELFLKNRKSQYGRAIPLKREQEGMKESRGGETRERR